MSFVFWTILSSWTTWDSGPIDPTAEAALKTDGTGTFKYLYEAGNDISKYDVYIGYIFDFPDGSIGSQGYYAPVLTVTSPGTDLNYTYDGSVLNLNLNEGWYMTNAQVVVTGLSGNPEDWYLKASIEGGSNQWDVPADFRNRTGGGWEYGISDPASGGISNGDGSGDVVHRHLGDGPVLVVDHVDREAAGEGQQEQREEDLSHDCLGMSVIFR